MLTPDPGVVYARHNSDVTLGGMIPGAGVSRTEWRFGKSIITNDQTGITITKRAEVDSQVINLSLTLSRFDAARHAGTYVLMVQNPVGVAMVAEWHIHEAGEPQGCVVSFVLLLDTLHARGYREYADPIILLKTIVLIISPPPPPLVVSFLEGNGNKTGARKYLSVFNGLYSSSLSMYGNTEDLF